MEINIQTVKFLKMLEELTELTNDEFTDFENLTQEQIEWECGIIYDKKNKKVLINDPLSGLVWRKASSFERIYNKLGKMAVVIQ